MRAHLHGGIGCEPMLKPTTLRVLNPGEMVSNIATDVRPKALTRADCAAELLQAYSKNEHTTPLPLRLNASAATHTWTSNMSLVVSQANTVARFLHNAVVRIWHGTAGYDCSQLADIVKAEHEEGNGFSRQFVYAVLSTVVRTDKQGNDVLALTSFLRATQANKKKSKAQRNRADRKPKASPAPRKKKDKVVVKASASAPDYGAIIAAAKQHGVNVTFNADGSMTTLV